MIAELLEDLAECLCRQICDDESPETCFCGVIGADGFVAEYAGNCREKCGSAWVRLITAYPSVTAGVPDTSSRNCGSSLGIEVEVGIVRCAPAPNSRGEAPAPEVLLESARQQAKDILTMRKAMMCCESLLAHDWVMGQYQPEGPQGGLVGGVWTLGVTL